MNKGIGLLSADFKRCVTAFLEGFEFHKYANYTEDCLDQCDEFSKHMQQGLDKWGHGQFYNGTLAVTDAFSVLSPLSRHCEETSHASYKVFSKYKRSFRSSADFFDKIIVNVMKNFKYIKVDFGLMFANWLSSPNYTYISGLAGEITKYTFVIEKEEPLFASEEEESVTYNKNYHPADPLSAAPMGKGWWSALEGTFKFLLNAKIATKESTQN